MDVYDSDTLLSILPKRLAMAVATVLVVALVLGYWLWPRQTTNYLYGQALRRGADIGNQLEGLSHTHCHVRQPGAFAAPRLICEPISTTTTTTSTTTLVASPDI